ncbi:MAG TPA: OsmC family protein [Longimicrobiales bacterium]|nr:OsmC family protein [Longimicrobiales bacterium]
MTNSSDDIGTGARVIDGSARSEGAAEAAASVTTSAGQTGPDASAPAGVPSAYAIEVAWQGGREFRGGPEGGPTLIIDGSRTVAPSPVDTVVVALAACSAIDVLSVLEKRRTPATDLSVRASFSRAATPPRRLTEVHLEWRVGTTSERQHIERAISLSMEKYCSVSASLAPDTRLTWALVDD